MKLCKFISGGRVAVTNDETGASLPQSKKPWLRIGNINVKLNDQLRVGASPREILGGVRERGYFIWPTHKNSST
jgi:hypothetical protein